MINKENAWLINDPQSIVNNLITGKIGIMPTDTIFGLTTLWNNFRGIKKIIDLKKRPLNKSFLILVASIDQLKEFIDINEEIINFIENNNSPQTIIFPWKEKLNFKPETFYYHPKTVAIRFIKWSWLQKIILSAGPIIATSCNHNNEDAIIEPKKLLSWVMFVDFICLNPRANKKASRIIDWKTKEILRD